MSATIIGFVLTQNLKEFKDDVILPLGFTKDGEIVDPCFCKCQLILWEDSLNNTCEIKPIGSDNVALLIQHNGNIKHWQMQQAKLLAFNWKPSHIGSFSHTYGDPFWEILRKLLKDEKNERAVRITQLVEHYDAMHSIRTLDSFAALKILSELSDSFNDNVKLKDSWGELSRPIKDRLNPENSLPLSLSRWLEVADAISFELIER